MEHIEIAVMPEITSSGIWRVENMQTCGMISFDELKIPRDLIKEFEEWIEFYDNDCHVTRHYHFRAEMADELNKRGRALAKKLKKVVPSIRVFYRGEIEGDMLPFEEITGV